MIKILQGSACTQTVLGAKGIFSSCKFPITCVPEIMKVGCE